ncbi:hypothetical protein D3C83_15240 [compost metagenome]
MAVISVSPCPVEHVLAVRMRLEVERHCAGQGAALPQQEILRCPAACARSAAGFMQRREELVTQERLAGRQAVPFLGRHAGERIDDFYRHFRAASSDKRRIVPACIGRVHDDILAT